MANEHNINPLKELIHASVSLPVAFTACGPVLNFLLAIRGRAYYGLSPIIPPNRFDLFKGTLAGIQRRSLVYALTHLAGAWAQDSKKIDPIALPFILAFCETGLFARSEIEKEFAKSTGVGNALPSKEALRRMYTANFLRNINPMILQLAVSGMLSHLPVPPVVMASSSVVFGTIFDKIFAKSLIYPEKNWGELLKEGKFLNNLIGISSRGTNAIFAALAVQFAFSLTNTIDGTLKEPPSLATGEKHWTRKFMEATKEIRENGL